MCEYYDITSPWSVVSRDMENTEQRKPFRASSGDLGGKRKGGFERVASVMLGKTRQTHTLKIIN